MDNEKFSIKRVAGNKNRVGIYKFIDNNNNLGRAHVKRSKYTPFVCQMDEKGAYVELCNRKFYINSLQELDAINNALNNYKRSTNALMKNMPYFFAEENRESALQIIYAIRQAIFEHEETLGTLGVYQEMKSINQLEDDLMCMLAVQTKENSSNTKQAMQEQPKTIDENNQNLNNSIELER